MALQEFYVVSTRAVVEQQIHLVARELKRRLAPLKDDLILLDSGLDSLCFALLVGRLEDKLGVDPFNTPGDVTVPVTFGEFVAFYDRALEQAGH